VSDWPDAIFDELDALKVRQVAYVPDAGHTRLIHRCAAHEIALWLPGMLMGPGF
jgi:hypothetical protein